MLHRALFTWFLILVFLILLALRLDKRTHWNWFIVFIPMWFYDAILLLYIGIHMFNYWRHAGIGANAGNNRTLHGPYQGVLRRLWHFLAVMLKIAFMVALCLKLNKLNTDIPWYAVFIPLLLLLTGLCVNVFHCLVLQYCDQY